MLPFVLTIPATVPQRSEIPEGLMNYPVYKGLRSESHEAVGVLLFILVNRVMVAILAEMCC